MSALVELGLSNALASVVFALFVVLISLFCRRATVLHALWLLVLIKLITPPLLSVPILWTIRAPSTKTAADTALEIAPTLLLAPPDVPLDLAEEQTDANDDPLATSVELVELPIAHHERDTPPRRVWNWTHGIGIIWVTGSLFWFTLAITRLRKFARWIRHGESAPTRLLQRVERLTQTIGLTRTPTVRLLPGRLSPMVWGAFSPILLLPQGLEEELGEEAIDTLLLHELAHLRRGDQWTRVLEFLVLGLFWWFPIAWIARRALRDAEEQCCDAWVVGLLPEARKVYANAIIEALDFLARPVTALPPLASGLGQVADLKRRLTMILRGSMSPRLGRSAVLAVFGFAFLLLPLVPSLGNAQPDRKKNDLEIIEQEIQRRRMEIEELSRKLRELARDRAAAAEAEARQRAEALGQRTEKKLVIVPGKPAEKVVTIQISGIELKPEEIKVLLEKIENHFPGKKPKITVEKGQDRLLWLYSDRGGKKFELEIVRVPGLPSTPMAPPKVTAPLPPGPGKLLMAVPAPRPETEKRLEKLERNVETILREIEALRKDSKKDGKGK